jgi:hypothetical protein
MKVQFLAGLLPILATSLACARRLPTTAMPNQLALRIVDSSRAGEPLIGARLRLVGPLPVRDIVVCDDSTRQTIVSLPPLPPGRYQVSVARIGRESRPLVLDVRHQRSDTVTIGLRYPTRDLEGPIVIGPPSPHCAARPNER